MSNHAPHKKWLSPKRRASTLIHVHTLPSLNYSPRHTIKMPGTDLTHIESVLTDVALTAGAIIKDKTGTAVFEDKKNGKSSAIERN